MSGVPFTETWSILSTYWYPFDRGYSREGTSGNNLVQDRTPFLWFANAYAEYNLRLADRYTVQFNVNVDNLFDTSTARRLYGYRTYYGLDVSEDMILSQSFDLDTPNINYVQDAWYKKEMEFYPPISVRLGVKFIF
jgi:hypothetical protein